MGTSDRAVDCRKMGDASSFYLLSVCLIVWIIISSLDLIISGARYFINKPYIREIVVEVEREVEPIPEKKDKPLKKEGKKKEPITIPTPEPRKTIPSDDDLMSFMTPSESLLKPRTGEVHKVSQDEIRRNIETIRETLADHHIKVLDIQAVTGPQ